MAPARKNPIHLLASDRTVSARPEHKVIDVVQLYPLAPVIVMVLLDQYHKPDTEVDSRVEFRFESYMVVRTVIG